jgi:hypothetical protein
LRGQIEARLRCENYGGLNLAFGIISAITRGTSPFNPKSQVGIGGF